MKFKLSCISMTWALVAAFTFGIVAVPAAKEGKKLTEKDLPPTVLAAFQKAYPKATIAGVDKEKEGGKMVFEIESVDGTIHRDLLYAPDGKVIAIEESVAIDQLPEAVRNAVTKEFPQGKIEKAEKVMRGAELKYEFLVQSGETTHEVVIDPSGKVLKKSKAEEEKEEEEKEEEESEGAEHKH